MNANSYICLLNHTRENLKEVYENKGIPCEPMLKTIWMEWCGERTLRNVFVHEKDKNRNTLKSFRYPYREI